jgi:hypothetical protein
MVRDLMQVIIHNTSLILMSSTQPLLEHTTRNTTDQQRFPGAVLTIAQCKELQHLGRGNKLMKGHFDIHEVTGMPER